VTLTDAARDNPLVVEVQVISKVNTTDAVCGANASVTAWLPWIVLAPAQLSAGPPPVAVQLVALDAVQMIVVDCPAAMVLGEAETDKVTGGQLQVTEVETVTAATPGPVQLSV
jgi:hypothetical protein